MLSSASHCRFGHLGDSRGRRVTLLWSILCVSVSSPGFWQMRRSCIRFAGLGKLLYLAAVLVYIQGPQLQHLLTHCNFCF
jgi:hypothetical protein